MPLPSPEAYRQAQLLARAAAGGLQEEALRNILASLDELANSFTRELALLGTQSHAQAVHLVRSREIIQNAYNKLNNQLQRVVGSGRAASFRQVRQIWDRAGVEAAQSVGVDGATLGRIRAPALTMMGAYEGLGGAAQTWRTLLQVDVQTAAREANALVRNGLLSGVGPDELGRQLRPYVAGSESYQDLFKRISTATGDVRKLDLRTLPRDLRTGARRMVHNANRIGFSELHNARLEAQVEHFNADPLIAAIDWIVSQFRGKTAKVPDECDFLMTSDYYGMGPGRYPLHAVPREPHPWGRCEERPVTRSTRDMKQPKPRPKRLKSPKHDPKVRQRVTSAKEFARMEARATDAVSFGEEAIAVRSGRAVARAPTAKPAPRKPPGKLKPAAPGNFTSRQQAEQWASSKWGWMGFDFTGCDLAVVNEMLAEFEVLAEAFPDVARYQLKGITTYRKLKPPRSMFRRWRSGVYAHATQDGWIGLNPNQLKRMQPFVEGLESDHALKTAGINKGTSYHPAGVKLKGNKLVRSVITHEYGHQVDNFLQRELADMAVSDVVFSDGTGLATELLNGWRSGAVLYNHRAVKLFPGRFLRADVSEYALHTRAEKFAETFVIVRHGTAAARGRSFARGLGQLLEQVLPEGRLSRDLLGKGRWAWETDYKNLAYMVEQSQPLTGRTGPAANWAADVALSGAEPYGVLSEKLSATSAAWDELIRTLYKVKP